ncbi:50S ribosomal protein L25 [Blattabacterium cuenoti]|uniref:50S ribosomal protein L25 n=1 Tax=Blattabacterium cuenoti TaxID=1653831 RepID=UPI00163BD237|nr:50S ribosomal protein L25 [Blattabacterium cuenoti]
MKYINIYGNKRNTGKKELRIIRSSGRIPCILYGKNMNIPFSISLDTLKKVIYRSELCGFIIQLEKFNENIKAIRKEVQMHPINDQILHIDFYKIDPLKSIIIEIPIKFVGRPIGVSKGGTFYSPLKKIKVKAKIQDLPDAIHIDIGNLNIGGKITVENIHNKTYQILLPMKTLIASVKISRTIIKNTTEEQDKESNK